MTAGKDITPPVFFLFNSQPNVHIISTFNLLTEKEVNLIGLLVISYHTPNEPSISMAIKIGLDFVNEL